MIAATECAEHIAIALGAISMPFDQVKHIFCNKEIMVLENGGLGFKCSMIEVLLETGTLTCLFNGGICIGALQFLDDDSDLLYYIDYCNNTFPALLPNCWLMNMEAVMVAVDHPECSWLVVRLTDVALVDRYVELDTLPGIGD